jgi:hypothetical protein
VIVLILWIVGIMLYGAMGAYVGSRMYLRANSYDRGFTASLTGIGWPIGLWILLGANLVDRAQAKEVERKRKETEKARLEDERKRIMAAAEKELENLF